MTDAPQTPSAQIQELAQALSAMCAEFRQRDLPYGSAAYQKATELLNQLRKPADPAKLMVMDEYWRMCAPPDMSHISEVAKIIEHGLAGNTTGVRDYAMLLLEKLPPGEDSRARRILETKLGLRQVAVTVQPLEA